MDIVSIVAVVALVVTFVAGALTVRRRGPVWPWMSATQFGLTGMMALLLTSNSVHSPALDLFDVAYALAYIGLSVYVFALQRRTISGG